MVVTRIGWVGAVQAANIGRAGPVGRAHVPASLLEAGALDRRPLDEAELRRPVEPDVEPASLAKHHRSGPAQDHARAGVRQLADALLALLPQALVMMAVRRR